MKGRLLVVGAALVAGGAHIRECCLGSVGAKLVRKGTTRAVAATLSYPAPNKVLLNQSRSLVRGATYTATIVGGASGVKDLASNALAASVRWSFKVRS